MSVARGYGLNGKSIYANVAKLTHTYLQFTVTPTNGLGITSLKSNGFVENVFMHTSTTPASNNGFLNPNPASGFALIQMKQNLNVFLGFDAKFVTPTTGSIKIDNGATLTLGQVYVITTVGDATAAQWATVGVPAGITAANGVTFTAIATGAGSGNTSTSRVSTPTTSGIDLVEVVGTPNVNTTSNIASNAGQWLTLQFSKQIVTMASYTPAGTVAAPVLTMNSYTPAGTITNGTPDTFAGTPAVLTGTNTAPAFTGTPATLTGTVSASVAAPATASICMLSLWWDGSSVTVDGL